MHSAQDPPQLYDQIQLVVYMLMIGASVGDLVQCVVNGGAKSTKRHKVQGRRKGGSASGLEVTISRVELDCPLFDHRKNWAKTIVPRLYLFARMVYRFRADDHLRYQYLCSDLAEQQRMILCLCPFLAGAPGMGPPRSQTGKPPAPENGVVCGTGAVANSTSCPERESQERDERPATGM
ncbi:unnamed protein product [Discosporangium mesarthrocarpum]